ncbi:hypothetical protein D9619_005346 [Psilocybe cf. subviscida]|uniref:Cytidyltransferase-like domain-containing protein n=1 Tax=Psilocybe cf. subviscida TaxID=2480587 RepID=A0A8H5FBB9_9AGAR|nr:hypothetical protein D9619_005346 [Psilocybe cf. subviscida]
MPTIGDPNATHPPSIGAVDNAVLLANLPNLTPPHFLAPVISFATSHSRKRLVIVLFSRHFNVQHPQLGSLVSAPATISLQKLTYPENQALSHTQSWDAVQRILTFAYVQAARVAQEMNKVTMDIDVLLKGLNEDLDAGLGTGSDLCFRVSGDSMAVPLPASVSSLRQCYIPPGDRHPESVPTMPGTPSPNDAHKLPSQFPVTALGGTFDHLHSGHKILLSMAAYITSKKLIVGITDDVLLKSKTNQHVLEKLPLRTERVRAFLNFIKPSIIPDIVPITDVYGPTGWDPNIQALVVSKETLDGAEAIAKHRAEHKLPKLETFLIDVISSTQASLDSEDAAWLKKHKLSSTYIRQWIVDNSKQEDEAARVAGEMGVGGDEQPASKN